MTKKDYVVIAAILHAERQAVKTQDGAQHGYVRIQAERTIDRLEASLLEVFKSDNPLFDRQRFLLASGGQIGGKA